MTRLVDVPDVDHRCACRAERLGKRGRLFDHAVLGREGGGARRRERTLRTDRVVLQVDHEQRGRARLEPHLPSAPAISAQVPTDATFCIA